MSRAVDKGDKVPGAEVGVWTELSKLEVKDIRTILEGKRTLLIGYQSAFPRKEWENHLESYVTGKNELAELGVELIAAWCVEDPSVMSAWSARSKNDGAVLIISDGQANFATACGLEIDCLNQRQGLRAVNSILIIDNQGVIEEVIIDAGKPSETKLERVLERLAHLNNQ